MHTAAEMRIVCLSATCPESKIQGMTIQVYAHLVQNEGELAKKLQNPVANLISVPLQSNWDFGIGPADALRYTLNVQPVLPLTLTMIPLEELVLKLLGAIF
jgi:hypothetical protein